MRRFSLAALISVGSLGCFAEPELGDPGTQTSGASTDGSTNTSSLPTTATTMGGQSSSSSSTSSTTEEPSTTTDPATTTESSSSSSSTTTTGDENQPDFHDDFEREDSNELGNDWEEKDEPVFSLQGGQAIGSGTPSQGNPNFHDWFVYQPVPARDVELITEFTVINGSPYNEPFILARVATDSLLPGAYYAGYMAVAGTEDPPGEGGSSEHLCIAVFDGIQLPPTSAWCAQQATGALSEGYQYRLRLQTRGGSPVQLSATLERRASEEDTWMPEAEVTESHNGSAAIETAGNWGFGGGGTAQQLPNYAYDSFSANFISP